MTAAEALAKIKLRLDIETSDTSFDAFINDSVLSAVARLFPLVQQPIPAQDIAISPSYGLAELELGSLATPVSNVKKIEGVGSTMRVSLDDFYIYGTTLSLQNVPENISTVKIYGLAAYSVIDDLPAHLTQAVLWYSMSEFYDMLSGEKSKYNIYMSNGARSVDNMKDESLYYEQKAAAFLNERTGLEGSS